MESCAAALLLGCFVTLLQLCPHGLGSALGIEAAIKGIGAAIKGISAPDQCQQSGGCSYWGFVRAPECVTGVQEDLYLPLPCPAALGDWMENYSVQRSSGEGLGYFKESHLLIRVEIC